MFGESDHGSMNTERIYRFSALRTTGCVIISAIIMYAISAIIANVNKQYIVAKCKDYIGYANETVHMMIAELMTHPVVLNAKKR